MLPNRSSNESTFIDLITHQNSSSNTNSSLFSSSNSNFVEIDENNLRNHLITAENNQHLDYSNLFSNDHLNEQSNDVDNFKLVDLKDDLIINADLNNSRLNTHEDTYLSRRSKQTLDNRSRSISSQSTSSNQTDDFSNEFDSFLKSNNSQINYLNRIKKKMKYKIKGVDFWLLYLSASCSNSKNKNSKRTKKFSFF